MTLLRHISIFMLMLSFGLVSARKASFASSDQKKTYARSSGGVTEFANHDALQAFVKSHSDKPTIVFFHRTSCPHCQHIWPHYKDLAGKHAGGLYFGAINVEHAHNKHLFGHYLQYAPVQIPATPYFVIFRNGSPVRGSLPGIPHEDLAAFVASA